MRDRTIQATAIGACLAAFVGGGVLLPRIVEQSDRAKLRYTDVSVEGAPPIVAVGAAIGALRGLVVDYLWIRLQQMRELGLFYDAQRLADLITKLQPRFGEVWAFHGHNLAYNLSVMTSTPEERWRLVNAGIDLIRNKGIRYNPNDLILYKELGWYFAHKVDGVSDDAHLHYKRELAREWQLILGAPPYEQMDRAQWMQDIADSPATYDELVAKYPEVKALVEKLTEALKGFDKRFQFKLDREFLMNLGRWSGVQSSPYAQMLGLQETFRKRDPVYVALDDVLKDPANRPAIVRLVAYLRKRVLLDDYNMDPAIMARYTREYGPLDWRHPQAHAFYWSKLGSEVAAERYMTEDEIYRILNDDRVSIQAMQALAHSGLMSVDPFSNDNPGRMYDTRWFKSIDKYFRELYEKHFRTRGAGGDTFVDFHQNFMAQAVRELYRAGDLEGAQQIMDELDKLYGRGGLIPNNRYARPLDVFVQETTFGEFEQMPDMARTDVLAVLRRGFMEGYLLDRKKVLDAALKYAADLTQYFKSSRYTDFVTKMGDRRMGDLVSGLERSVEDTLVNLMRDSTIPIVDRLTIYNKLPEEQRAMCYDAAKDALAAEFSNSPLAGAMNFASVFPEPPNMEAYRARQAEQARQREAAKRAREENSTELRR
jgi:hypothetical protein